MIHVHANLDLRYNCCVLFQLVGDGRMHYTQFNFHQENAYSFVVGK